MNDRPRPVPDHPKALVFEMTHGTRNVFILGQGSRKREHAEQDVTKAASRHGARHMRCIADDGDAVSNETVRNVLGDRRGERLTIVQGRDDRLPPRRRLAV
jgi:hypothetical protein